MLTAGDTLYIGAGTYIEDPAIHTFNPGCGWWTGTTASLCMRSSGSAGKLITVSAAPGAEGQVVVDSQNVRIGLVIDHKHYIAIKNMVFRNNYTIGVGNLSQYSGATIVPEQNSIGCVIENNQFYNTNGDAGDNISAIGMWGSQGWVVRNNLIDGVRAGGTTLASGIQAYGVIEAKVQHNTMRNVAFGVFWKDHFVQNETTRGFYQESEISYNDIWGARKGIYIGIKGGRTPEAGHNNFHHNVIHLREFDSCGICVEMLGAYAISGNVSIRNNTIDGNGSGATTGITIDSSTGATIVGNIMSGVGAGIALRGWAHLIESNYNIFDPSFLTIVSQYEPGQTFFRDLPSWQAVLNGAHVNVNLSRPDLNSVTASPSALFTNPATGNVTNKAGSPALGRMPDGTNAGAYQLGTERIGSSL